MTEPLNKSLLRSKFRDRRRAVTDVVRREAEADISHALLNLLADPANAYIATYLPNDGEVDLRPCHQTLRSQSVDLALPVVEPDRAGRMEFHHWAGNAELNANRYGILEPAVTQALLAEDIAAVLVPLVAFTSSGNRLGMGGGYYDRWIAQLTKITGPSALPHLIGIGFEAQRAPDLPTEPQDQRLDYVVTERKVYDCRKPKTG